MYVHLVYSWRQVVYKLFLFCGVPGISGNLVVKSKLPPRSDSGLKAVEPYT